MRRKIEFICPRGRRTTRTVSGSGPVTIRCSCGCGYIFKQQLR